MADIGNVETMLAGLDSEDQRVFKPVFTYILKDIRFGRSEGGEASKNFGGGFFFGLTPSTPDEEFFIEHTFGRTPYLLIPVLPLDQVGAKIVRLENARAADSAKVYLKSPDTDAPVFIYIEG